MLGLYYSKFNVLKRCLYLFSTSYFQKKGDPNLPYLRQFYLSKNLFSLEPQSRYGATAYGVGTIPFLFFEK